LAVDSHVEHPSTARDQCDLFYRYGRPDRTSELFEQLDRQTGSLRPIVSDEAKGDLDDHLGEFTLAPVQAFKSSQGRSGLRTQPSPHVARNRPATTLAVFPARTLQAPVPTRTQDCLKPLQQGYRHGGQEKWTPADSGTEGVTVGLAKQTPRSEARTPKAAKQRSRSARHATKS
jgi:hypothetical protein